MSPDQCRAARERLNWTRYELSKASDVPLWFVTGFENGHDSLAFLARHERAMRHALKAVGIGFPFEIENGRIKPAGVTYTPREKGELN